MSQAIIYKYPLEVVDFQDIMLPDPHQVLSVANQGGKIQVWVMHPVPKPDTRRFPRRFYMIGTGNSFSGDEPRNFVGTVFWDVFVWHIFTDPYAF